jgi:hypothetical protein
MIAALILTAPVAVVALLPLWVTLADTIGRHLALIEFFGD